MSVVTNTKNWAVTNTPVGLKEILEEEINISIYDRDISTLQTEVDQLIDDEIEFHASGTIKEIMEGLAKEIGVSSAELSADIYLLLTTFKRIAETENFKLMLSTINSNMCRRFHADINDLRMLCTYSGPGTLWLTDDNINSSAMSSREGNESIVLDETKIQQAATGSVIILKGALFPAKKTKAIVHRSPTIEESGEKRLLFRIDTNQTLDF